VGITIWLYCIFGNEAQLMPYFLRHYSPLVDRLIMLDGGSDDGSDEIARACPNAEVRDSRLYGVMDADITARYASEKYREARWQADYVLWVDCDEFIYSAIPLRELLIGYGELGIRSIQLTGYQMLSDEFPADDDQLTNLVRLGVRDREYDKMSIFDPALDITWLPGHHNFSIPREQAYQSSEIKLLHYRYFGEAYTRARNANLYTHKSVAEIESGRGYHVQPGYESGKYSVAWYKQKQADATDVI
jgi:glycosyltransferase involved in cell wall biosynthesis